MDRWRLALVTAALAVGLTSTVSAPAHAADAAPTATTTSSTPTADPTPTDDPSTTTEPSSATASDPATSADVQGLAEVTTVGFGLVTLLLSASLLSQLGRRHG